MPTRSLLRLLARAFLAGEATVEGLIARAAHALGREWYWLGPLARRYVTNFSGLTRPRHRDVIFFLTHDRGFCRACAKYANQLDIQQWLTERQVMQPVPAAKAWGFPAITSAGELAEWLRLVSSELDWFADLKDLSGKAHRRQLEHYHYRLLRKSSSGAVRLIEAPKPRLKELQRRILLEILNKIPAHPAVHGFVKGRSIRTFIDPHVGRRVVLRMDLRDFFPTISGVRVQAFFRTIGYPEAVADLLGGICTNAVPRRIWRQCASDVNPRDLWGAEVLYARPHLPQGAPTSPALANICAYRMDCRLSGLAKWAGAQYTRYADDLAFSGDEEFSERIERFSLYVGAIALDEGFLVHHRKTRIMPQGVRQHLAGLVVNQRPNVIRADRDRLKAVLTNCIRSGPETQNHANHADFRSHLEGRVGFVEMINPEKAKYLRKILEKIEWQ